MTEWVGSSFSSWNLQPQKTLADCNYANFTDQMNIAKTKVMRRGCIHVSTQSRRWSWISSCCRPTLWPTFRNVFGELNCYLTASFLVQISTNELIRRGKYKYTVLEYCNYILILYIVFFKWILEAWQKWSKYGLQFSNKLNKDNINPRRFSCGC